MLMGAGSEMINKMKQNRALRKKPNHNIFIFKEIEGLNSLKLSQSKLKKFSPKEFKSFKSNLKEERGKRSLKLSFLFVSILVLFFLLVYFYLSD